jgi:hypothetical protein
MKIDNKDRVMMNFRLPKEIRRRFRTQCITRDANVTQVMYDLICRQLEYWDKQSGVRP